MTSSEDSLPRHGRNWFSVWWCLPALWGFLAFLFAFPIERRIPHWLPLTFAEIFTLWFLFVTPATTVVAIVSLIKRNRTERIPRLAAFFTWIAIAASLVVNALVLLGMWATTY
jgi:hypothetical protein